MVIYPSIKQSIMPVSIKKYILSGLQTNSLGVLNWLQSYNFLFAKKYFTEIFNTKFTTNHYNCNLWELWLCFLSKIQFRKISYQKSDPSILLSVMYKVYFCSRFGTIC